MKELNNQMTSLHQAAKMKAICFQYNTRNYIRINSMNWKKSKI